jgi:hypothetical protein
MKDLLRFDTVVAACALLMSAVTAGAMVYQTRVLQDQFSATVWPYLAVNVYYGSHNLEFHLANQGVGPALIRSAQVIVDRKPLRGWNRQFFSAVFGQNALSTKDPIQDQSVDASNAIRAGDDLTLLKMRIGRSGVIPALLKHDVTLRFCYCSINGRCWNVQTSTRFAQASVPISVPVCDEHYTIAAPPTGIAK